MQRSSKQTDWNVLSFLICLLWFLATNFVKEEDPVVVFRYSVSAFITTMGTISRHKAIYCPDYQRNNHIDYGPSGSRRVVSRLRGKPDKSNEDGNFDVDAARKQLETLVFRDGKDALSGEKREEETKVLADDYSLITALLPTISLDVHPDGDAKSHANISDKKDSNNTIGLPSPPPLSTIERDRRLAEIHLLDVLRDGDDATDSLWELWYSERGKTAKSQLEKADKLMTSPSTHKECEEILKELINTHGVYFVEPLNRLATLWYIQGKYEDSHKLCRIIYQIKPYHFGMLAGIVACCIALRDRSGARIWAEKRLPKCAASTSFPPFVPDESVNNPRRTEWVNSAVLEAKKRLQQAEKETKRGLGKPENYYFIPPSSSMNVGGDDDQTQSRIDNVDDDDAWN